MDKFKVDLGIKPEPAVEIIAVRLVSIFVFEPDVSPLVPVRTGIKEIVKVVHTVKIELAVDRTELS